MNRTLNIITACMTALLLASIIACNKGNDSTTPNPPATAPIPLWKAYKDLLPGAWTWSHKYEFYPASGPGTVRTYADTSFPVTLLNDSTLSVYDHRMAYTDSIHYTDHVAHPGDTAHFVYYYDRAFLGSYINCSLTLNRSNDSLVLVINNGWPHTTQTTTFRTKIRP
jgi:hypothetical protein